MAKQEEIQKPQEIRFELAGENTVRAKGERYNECYSNHTEIALSNNDFRMKFSHLFGPEADKIILLEQVAVTMSFGNMVQIYQVLRRSIQGSPTVFGEIQEVDRASDAIFEAQKTPKPDPEPTP